MTTKLRLSEGDPLKLGATFDGEGVNFAVFSDHATAMQVCLYDDLGRTETARLTLPERDEGVWHGYVPGLRPGQRYGLRAQGPFAPQEGHRFNANKLLLDPYAKRLTGHPRWHDALMGYTVGGAARDLGFDARDSAPFMPRCVVEDPSFAWGADRPPGTKLADTVIYETHVKGMTALHPQASHRGTFLGMASDPVLDHLVDLGITAIELLPVQAFLNDRFLVERNLTNYWGYQTLGFFAPDPRYLHRRGIAEFQHMVARMHSAGIEVLLDVVYNHTCEGNHLGPTLSFRGLDNRSYYRLAQDPRFYIDDTGCGNTLNIEHPMVLRMVMDSLRYWVEVMHVDGFRFDLCAALGRTPQGFDGGAAFFDAIRQDPVLNRVKLIAEPWDIGPGGYQLGAFPPPFLEWNDQFRDGVRRFWRGDAGHVPELANRISGSALQFDHSGRPATSSVNLLTAHDGFTLMDVVSYSTRHNEANGEHNRDGHRENCADNMGAEGFTEDPAIEAARDRRRRNMMATLLLSQGTPMILGGDEIGNSQSGNNNAYCQDNPIGWIQWDEADEEFLRFTRRLIRFRKDHPILRQKLFLHARERRQDGLVDLFWRREDGRTMTQADWDATDRQLLCAELRMASDTPAHAQREEAIYLIFNGGEERLITLPRPPRQRHWWQHIDTALPDARPSRLETDKLIVADNAVVALVQQADDD